jgi:hypothetical protein
MVGESLKGLEMEVKVSVTQHGHATASNCGMIIVI